MRTVFLLSYLLLIHITTNQLFAQNRSNCDCAECNQFNFWVGNWKATWQDSSGNNYTGSNTINKILNGCVIEENFNGNPAISYKGKSFSVYNKNKKIWEQTWVDSRGNYMLFTGGMQDDKMILSRKVVKNNSTILQRMVFYDIVDKSFNWNWESSGDEGMNWKINWSIHYTRK